MKITTIDYWATSRTGWLHRTPVGIKVLGVTAVIAAVIAVWSPWVLLGIVAVLIIAALTAGLPPKLLFTLAAYPLLFTGILVLTTQMGWRLSAAVLLKGFTAAFATLMVVLSTPYPRLFALTGRLLPRLVNDALLLTYRTLFIIADELTSLLRAAHLRGNISRRHPLQALRALGTALGNLMLFSLTLAEDDYDLLRMRGYDGTIELGTPRSERTHHDC